MQKDLKISVYKDSYEFEEHCRWDFLSVLLSGSQPLKNVLLFYLHD